MHIYGICINDIKNIKEDGLENLLKVIGIYDRWIETKAININNNISDFLHEVDDDKYLGITKLIKILMDVNHNIEMHYFKEDDKIYLGIIAGAPWSFKDTMKYLKEKEFIDTLRVYIKLITDEEIEIRWYIK